MSVNIYKERTSSLLWRTKSEFRDAICIRYDRPLRGMHTKFPCGQKFDVTHVINCKSTRDKL